MADIKERLRETGAILEGHFLLSSGLHSDKYVQCASLLQHPHHAEWCGAQLSESIPDEDYDLVISPAVGGIVIGQEVARALGIRHIFVEKENGDPALRRNFHISEEEVALVVEDVVTTGKSTKEVMNLARSMGAEIAAVCSIVNRGGGNTLGVPFAALTELDIKVYDPENCPLCDAGKSVVKPGSRKMEG